MSQDEISGYPVASQITRSLGMIYPNGEILVHFEMEVGGVHAMIVSYITDLLAFLDLLSLAHPDPVQVGIE